jgi:uncharacterized radical SAM superfamily Fe-S cluster-containing enzyme
MWQLAEGAATDSWEECVRELRRSTLTVSAMAFQDAWNLDLERLRACRVLVLSRDRKLVPFCAYYLTDSEGRRLRRSRSEAAPGQGRAKAP